MHYSERMFGQKLDKRWCKLVHYFYRFVVPAMSESFREEATDVQATKLQLCKLQICKATSVQSYKCAS